MDSRVGQKSRGFTLIEVIIVLAIVGMLLMVILLIVPAFQRNGRNYQRKHTATLVYNQMVQYRTDTGVFPSTDDDGAAFITGYLGNVSPNYTVVFRDNNASHSDKPDYDDIYVQYAHWCTNVHGGADHSGDLISAAPGSHSASKYFSVFYKLENNIYQCIDNG